MQRTGMGLVTREGIRFLIVSFDGLRPDLIDGDLTPNICRLQNRGVTLARHRTIYPSETRTGFPSLVTGATPSRHGMIGNKYIDRRTVPNRYLDTSDADLLDRLNRESGGRLMTAETLGEALAACGKSLAVLSTNTPGTTRLFHHKGESFGHIRLSGHFKEACTPAAVLAEAEAAFGPLPPVPPRGEPDIEAQTYITTAFLELVWPKYRPDVTILAYGEPDLSSHFNGTGASDTRDVIAHCDRQFGRVLDWWDAEGRDLGFQILIASDHGHVTAHTRVSVSEALSNDNFGPGTEPGDGVDVVVVPGQVGALYLAKPTLPAISRLVASITEKPWCGPVFTRPGSGIEGIAPGSFGSDLVFADHARAPDVYFAFRSDDSLDPYGLVGGTYYDNDRRPGLGVHGGLHPREMAAVGGMAGSEFHDSGVVSLMPSGICDFAPTILELLGIAPPATMNGRVLRETLRGGPTYAEAPDIEPEILETGLGGYSQALRRVRVGETVYIDGGWAGDGAAEMARENRAWADTA